MLFSNGVLTSAVAAKLFFSPAPLVDETSVARLQPVLESFPGFLNHSFQSSVIQTGSWHWDGIELHASKFKIGFEASRHDPFWFAGFYPATDLTADGFSFSAGHRLDAVQAKSFFAEHMRIGSWQIAEPKPIFQVENGELVSWWKLRTDRGRVYWMREADGFWGEEVPLPLHAKAKALLYRENKVASAEAGLEEIQLSDLLDVSYLRNKFFRVLNCLGSKISYEKCGNYARSVSGFYKYPYESSEYSEMVGYYSIQRAMEWHRGIQSDTQKTYFENFALKGPIDVFVRADANNAPFYVHRSSTLESDNPAIVVSTGAEDNVTSGTLSFLSKDSDVLFHEFSHHIIYRSVQPNTSASQARAIQEGLADYFAYAITGNNRLGESTYGGEPLRQGNLSSALASSLFSPSGNWNPYDVGDILSSALWSLRQIFAEWKDGYNQIDKIVWDAIDLLPPLATNYQFACAVYVSAGNFEKQENLPTDSLRSPVANEFVKRLFFTSATPDTNALCPPISSILRDVDVEESLESGLPLIETPKNTVTFTGEGKPALPPFSGSLYQPIQPRRTVCGSVASSPALAKGPLLFFIFAPVVIGSMLHRFARWRNRFPKKSRVVEAK